MILDTVEHQAAYQSLSPRVARGFAWLTGFTPEMPDGRYEIAGAAVFALVQSYTTTAAADKKYEAHRDYLDIQYVAEGSEIIYHAPVGRLQPLTGYDADKDYQLYADPETATVLQLTPGSFALFYPQDGHKPGCAVGPACRVKKVVIKVRV